MNDDDDDDGMNSTVVCASDKDEVLQCCISHHSFNLDRGPQSELKHYTIHTEYINNCQHTVRLKDSKITGKNQVV